MELGIGGLDRATEIGAGASAVVYKAVQVDLDREVAVKVLSATDEAFVRRFHREAKTLGKLSLNPGIVTVHGTGVTESGQLYLILELCESSVLDHLKSQGRFDPESACDVGAQIADAVSDAHTNGVIHRDIKPANLLRSQNGRYLITDFGISTVRGSTLGHTDSIGFTAGYAAPEILKGEDAGTPADVYSLGATLFHMLAGHPPFVDQAGNSNLLALAQRIINDPVPDLRIQAVPDDICRIVEGAMAKRPIDRPSAAQLRDQLQAVAGQVPPGRSVPPVVPGNPAPTIGDGTPSAMPPARPRAAVPIGPADEFGSAALAPQGPAPASTGASQADQTLAMPDSGAAATGMMPQPAGHPHVQDHRVLSGDTSGAAVPPGRASYPLPPHSNDGPPPWKLLLLGVLATSIVLLGAIALVIARSDDGGETDATDTVLEGPSANDQASEGNGNDGDGGVADSLPDGSKATTAETPNVVGGTEDEARRRLTDDGFDVRVERRVSEDDAPGSVITQFPSAGTDHELGSIVTIVVAVAPETEVVDVPVVVGLTEAEAKTALNGVGLTVAEPTFEFNESPIGQVIGSNPVEGSSVDSTSSVALFVSKGLEPPGCDSLIGLTEEAATDLVEAANLTASSTRAENQNDPEGRVTGCAAAANTINLVVSDGPEICGVVTGLGVAEGTAALEGKGYTVTATGVVQPDTPAGEIFECTKQQRSATISFATGIPTECPAGAFGVSQAEARTALETVGISRVTVERVGSDAVPSGRVIDCQLSGATATLTISSGPVVQTGDLTVSLDSIIIESDCAGDGLRPELYGSLSFAYDGATKPVWDDRPRGEFRTPGAGGQLRFTTNERWSDVPVGGELVATWDLKDADTDGRAGDEDGDDDNVSAASRKVVLTGEQQVWRPPSDANDDCALRLNVTINWADRGD